MEVYVGYIINLDEFKEEIFPSITNVYTNEKDADRAIIRGLIRDDKLFDFNWFSKLTKKDGSLIDENHDQEYRYETVDEFIKRMLSFIKFDKDDKIKFNDTFTNWFENINNYNEYIDEYIDTFPNELVDILTKYELDDICEVFGNNYGSEWSCGIQKSNLVL